MKLALLALLLAAPPPARACLTQGEAESAVLVAMPELLRQTGSICSGQLPASSLVRLSTSPLLSRYQIEADRAWPAARAALVKLSDPQADALLDSQFARPLLLTLVVPLITERIATTDCRTIDRLVTALEPLPPRNTAAAVVTAIGYFATRKPMAGARNQLAGLPLCQTGGG